MVPADQEYQFVESFEIVVVVCEEHATGSDDVHEVGHVVLAGKIRLGRRLNVVPRCYEEADQQCVNRVIIQVEIHPGTTRPIAVE